MNEALICKFTPDRTQRERRVVRPRPSIFASEHALTLPFNEVPGGRPGHLQRGLARGWHHLAKFDIDAALRSAQRVDLQAATLPGSAAAAVRGETAALCAAAFVLQDDVAHALSAVEFALRSGVTSPVALTACRWVYWRLGDIEKLYAVKRRQPGSQPSALHAITGIFDLAIDAAIALSQMHFRAARVLAQDALDFARRHMGHTLIDAFPACVAAQVLYEAGRIDDAEALLAPRLRHISQGAAPEIAVRSYGLLARIALQRGQVGRAITLLEEAETLAIRRGWPRLQAASLAGQIEAHLIRHCADEAEIRVRRLARLDEQQEVSDSSVNFEILRYRVLGEARLALVRAPDTVDTDALHRLYEVSRVRRDRYGAAMIGLLLVEAILATNRRDEAMLLLVTLIESAAQSGLHQTLVDCSEPVCGLIEVIVRGESELVEDQRELLPYLGALMMRRRVEIQSRTVRAASVRLGKLTPPMGLSEREHTIVRLMGSGLTNKQIAAHLRIAPETVKSHAKHLYEKLSVKNRTEAVTLASRYGLV